MTVKETAKRVIDRLPDKATMDDIIHALYVRAKFHRGEREIRDGKGVAHREAKHYLNTRRTWGISRLPTRRT